jgi:hypothetical protein
MHEMHGPRGLNLREQFRSAKIYAALGGVSRISKAGA